MCAALHSAGKKSLCQLQHEQSVFVPIDFSRGPDDGCLMDN